MAKNQPQGRLVVAIFVTLTLVSPLNLRSQTSYTQPNTTHACIANTLKIFSPNMTSPTVAVVVAKFLTGLRVCNTVAMNNAFCNPGSAAPTFTLAASAMGTQITMMPSCQWACTGCANVTTTSSGDGLPVELMGFGIEEEVLSNEDGRAESGRESADGKE